ncbi:MAG: phosphopyruvate hydratase [Firmicutes bacterium]|nr:phosphopyruvate hydratase [Bacillota bacterium]
MARECRIEAVRAREILDSRGNPTIEVEVEVDGAVGRAAVPSGASTGSHEAVELRDGDPGRYRGKGVRRAVEHVRGEIAARVVGLPADDTAAVDAALVALDGTPNKGRLGANAVLGVSLAAARAAANWHQMPLYRFLGGAGADLLPVPFMNVINGGKHADSGLSVQECMIVPHGAATFAEALRMGAEVYHALHDVLAEEGAGVAVGDEGGFAPHLGSEERALDTLMRAIERAGYRPGEDVALALDSAATSFQHGDVYRLGERTLTAEELVEVYAGWADRYPLVLLEDGLGEEDWEGWKRLTARLGGRLELVGDDIFVTQVERIERGVREGVANAVLIKVNQVGTLTETIRAVDVATACGYRSIVSHRSGETEDPFIADLAVALGTGRIKTGAPARSERVAKYNQLLRIEEELERPRFAGRLGRPGRV